MTFGKKHRAYGSENARGMCHRTIWQSMLANALAPALVIFARAKCNYCLYDHVCRNVFAGKLSLANFISLYAYTSHSFYPRVSFSTLSCCYAMMALRRHMLQSTGRGHGVTLSRSWIRRSRACCPAGP